MTADGSGELNHPDSHDVDGDASAGDALPGDSLFAVAVGRVEAALDGLGGLALSCASAGEVAALIDAESRLRARLDAFYGQVYDTARQPRPMRNRRL